MTTRPLRVMQVGTVETGGGAASVATSLVRGYRARGCEAWLAVGRKTSDDPTVFALPDDDRRVHRLSGYTALQQQLRKLAGRHSGRGWGRVSRGLRLVTHPGAVAAETGGLEDFEFPGTYGLLDLMPSLPDIVHCHNLHGGYFDLRALRWLSRRVPTVLTLHDAWLLTGHCAHSFDCDRWTTGCGACPDLTIYPAIRRDATAANWIRKRDIYASSRLYVTTPSGWLMQRVERSMLGSALAGSRMIPNGVDLTTFHPMDRDSARRAVGLPTEGPVVLLVLGRNGQWDDGKTLGETLDAIAERMSPHAALFLAVGRADAAFHTDRAEVRWVAYQTQPEVMARYYQAANIYLHATRAATFPSTILEALACGTPVVAAAVGGIPEQIVSGKSGRLVAPGSAAALAEAVVSLLGDTGAARLERFAACDARERFDLNRQIESYLEWYRAIIEHWNGDAERAK